MDTNHIQKTTEDKLQKALEHFEDELKKLRTGRAHAGMLDGVTVEAYGTPMPLNQVATISTPEPQLLQITPFDPNNLSAISAAIREDQSLGLNPMDDGRVVRIQIPALTTERREQIAKQLSGKIEDALISMRQARHEALKEVEAAKKDKSISEDDYKRFEKQIDDLMQNYKQKVEETGKNKEQEIMTV